MQERYIREHLTHNTQQANNLKSQHDSTKVEEMEAQLRNRLEQESIQRIKLERFRDLCQPFYSIYESLSHCGYCIHL